MSVTGEELNKCASDASCISVRIYNIIREVGQGNLTADNALHQLVEDMKNARDLYDRLLELSKSIPWDGGGGGEEVNCTCNHCAYRVRSDSVIHALPFKCANKRSKNTYCHFGMVIQSAIDLSLRRKV